MYVLRKICLNKSTIYVLLVLCFLSIFIFALFVMIFIRNLRSFKFCYGGIENFISEIQLFSF